MSDEQIKELHTSIHYVCSASLEVLGDSEKFPEHWLFKHRWGKGKKNQPAVLPNGDKITFLTVGGRTSAVVPSVQKKTGAVAKDFDESTNGTPANSKRKRAAVKKESDTEAEEVVKPKSSKSQNKKKRTVVKNEDSEEEKKPDGASLGRRRSTRTKT